MWGIQEKGKRRWFVIAMSAAAIPADLLDFLLQNAETFRASRIAIVFFLGYAVVTILFYLVRQEEVTADMMMAGASEYILIGVLRACFYVLIETVYPGSFNFAGAQMDRSGFLYFSFVTLTTASYGELLADIGSVAIRGHTRDDYRSSLHRHDRGTARESLHCPWK